MININISELQSNDPITLLGAFDLNVRFDRTIFDYISVEWGAGLGNVGLGDAIAFDTITSVTNVLWEVNLKEVSLLPTDLLQPLQSNNFTLATLAFYAPNANRKGEFPFFAPSSQIILSDAKGDQFAYSGSTPSTSVRIPEPAACFMIAMGLLGLSVIRKVTHT